MFDLRMSQVTFLPTMEDRVTLVRSSSRNPVGRDMGPLIPDRAPGAAPRGRFAPRDPPRVFVQGQMHLPFCKYSTGVRGCETPAADRGQTPSRSRIAYQVMAVTRSGQRSSAPPGKRYCGRLAIRSKRSICPVVASAISLPASVAMATP